VSAAVLAALAAFAPSAHAVRDFSSTARNIIPSGQWGGVPPVPQADSQAELYDGLTPLFDDISNKDLNHYFKSEKLGTKGQGPLKREPVPRKGVRIIRDRFNVPHVYGRSNDDVTWGAGWALAHDRELLLEQARYNARVAVIDAPGETAIDLIVGLKTFVPSAQTEREVQKEVAKLERYGKPGRLLLHDIDLFVKGINAYYKSAGAKHKPWTRRDVIALNAVKSELFGEGGGAEVESAEFLNGLQTSLGADCGYSVWHDLRKRQDPETPVSIPGNFPYAPLPATRSGNMIVDNGSFQPIPTPTAATAGAARELRGHASNVLMVAGKRSRSGHALFVGGPQIGYFYPGLTLEMDLHGPGWSARGATSAPFPGYILIGRREDFVWTLTSAGADIVDNYVETLCDGSDTKYMYRGKCRSMTPFNAGSIGGQAVTFNRTVHGPVTGYATVGGTRVAISQQRSSYMRDAQCNLLFKDATENKIKSPKTFFKSAALSPFTFNVAYADNKHIATYSAGRLPLRNPHVDPRLPTKGTGEFEWTGFLSANAHAHQADPKTGLLVNWNNKPAPNWGSADDNWAYGSVYRSQMLVDNLAEKKRHTLASVTGAMNAAATQDFRSVVLTPLLDKVLAGSTPPSARAGQMLAALDTWRTGGSSRLDVNLDGKGDAGAGPAIWDALYPVLADAVLAPQLGPQNSELSSLVGRLNAPSTGFQDGRIWILDKDLRGLLGEPLKAPYHTKFCGSGDKAACQATIWQAFQQAGDQIAAAQGSDVAGWFMDANAERIKFAPGLLQTTIRYTNRPSGIQQVISFKGHRK